MHSSIKLKPESIIKKRINKRAARAAQLNIGENKSHVAVSIASLFLGFKATIELHFNDKFKCVAMSVFKWT